MKKLWGGAFEEGSTNYAEWFGQSIDSDLAFWREDVIGSIAHARMLGKTGIISKKDSAKIVKGLKQILEEGVDKLPLDVEDVHTAVEVRLRKIVGDVAGRLHTARSRNDQVATDTRLYLALQLDLMQKEIKQLQSALLLRAIEHKGTLMPGVTHQQHAQPVTLGFHLLAYFWAFQRHGFRLQNLLEIVDRSPLGSAALAGTSFPIDRQSTATELEFKGVIPNALDATSDRSHVMDALHLNVQVMTDLSRMAQEFVLWSTPEFGWVSLPDSLSTGSSIMPQKRNPDAAELVRGHAGRVLGHYVSAATMMKGLVLGYNRDTQDDKPPLFDSDWLTFQSLFMACQMVCGARWNVEKMAAATRGDFSTATDLADFLAKQGVPFRTAHEQVGKIVRACMDRKIGLEDLTPDLLKKIAPKVPKEALKVLDPRASVNSRESEGGTGPKAVAKQIRQAKALLQAEGFKKPY
ncbi:MAG: argininosuccinate lyase [Fimbriimonadaceae bacterium]